MYKQKHIIQNIFFHGCVYFCIYYRLIIIFWALLNTQKNRVINKKSAIFFSTTHTNVLLSKVKLEVVLECVSKC